MLPIVRQVQLSENEEGVFCAVGIHPNDVDVEEAEWGHSKAGGVEVSAVETGWTGFRVASKENQQLFFDRHIALAQATELPLVIHTRDSIRDARYACQSDSKKRLTGVLHAFTGTAEEAKEAVELGFFIGFAGMVTFRSAGSYEK